MLHPYHWRLRALEARTQADQLNDPLAKSAMQRIAESYDRMAQRALHRALQAPTYGRDALWDEPSAHWD